jgi:hypothetical protein
LPTRRGQYRNGKILLSQAIPESPTSLEKTILTHTRKKKDLQCIRVGCRMDGTLAGGGKGQGSKKSGPSSSGVWAVIVSLTFAPFYLNQ